MVRFYEWLERLFVPVMIMFFLVFMVTPSIVLLVLLYRVVMHG